MTVLCRGLRCISFDFLSWQTLKAFSLMFFCFITNNTSMNVQLSMTSREKSKASHRINKSRMKTKFTNIIIVSFCKNEEKRVRRRIGVNKAGHSQLS